MFGLEERALVSPREMEERSRLLASRGLTVPGNESVILGFFEEERLVATGSLVGNILQGIAVDRELEGEGVAATVTSALLKKAMQMGRRPPSLICPAMSPASPPGSTIAAAAVSGHARR